MNARHYIKYNIILCVGTYIHNAWYSDYIVQYNYILIAEFLARFIILYSKSCFFLND